MAEEELGADVGSPEEPKSGETSPEPPPAGGPHAVLDELKNQGIGAALLKQSGALVYATIALDDATATTLASMGTMAQNLLHRVGDRSLELELSADNDLVVLVPVKSYFLCGILKNREQKQILRSVAARLSSTL